MGKLFPEVSGQVVTLFTFPACLRQSGGSCTQDKFVMPLHPDTRICTQFKFCCVTDFWLRDSLYPMTLASGFGQGLRRDTAPVLTTKFVTRDKFVVSDQTYTPFTRYARTGQARHTDTHFVRSVLKARNAQ